MTQDDELVARAKTGSEAAWAELYLAHAGRLQVWLRTLATGDAALASEDVAAEAWLVAAEKIGGFSGGSSDFAGWLFGIARNLALNGRRRTLRRRTEPATPDSDHRAVWGSPDSGVAAVEGMDLVRRTRALLPPREAEVVACRDVVGLDVAATAAALGVGATAVRVAHHRAHARLRRVLAPPAATSEVVVRRTVPERT